MTDTVFSLPVFLRAEIYLSASRQTLEGSGDGIKPSGGETITVQPSANDGGSDRKSGCC